MKPFKLRAQLQAIISMLVSVTLVFSLTSSVAFAEISRGGAQAGSGAVVSANADQFAAADSELFPQAEVKEPYDINVTVGLPSESNVKKDLAVGLTYNDNFFEKASSTFNNDLAYASTCLAAAADNSNEGGNNYKQKSKNVVSFLQQIDCNDVTTNDGYNFKPMEKANIGVAIGYKDIRVSGKTYRLFVFGVRGGGYEEEWAPDMRVGTEGDATGFQEARDGVIGFIMPYIKKHTENLNGDVNVKIWGSGYCRGGTATNMTFGWLNKWVYERNNGAPYKPYTQSYNQEHSVFGDSYSAKEMRYTGKVSFSPSMSGGYLASNVKISQDDLYAYPVNCPFGADATDVNNHEPIMTGIHNLINPDDWFPQVIMDWWGFKRYGYTRDHDITGTYATDGSLHSRNASVWNPEDKTRSAAVSAMIGRLKQIDPNTAFNSTFFRQQYFSKAAAVGNIFKKVGAGILNTISVLIIKKTTIKSPDVFSLSIDKKGEGNKFYSVGTELKYNQGGYYQEFMKFLLNAGGFSSDPAQARKHYVDNYQDAFIDLMDWVCGQPLEVREKLPKVGSGKIKVAFEQMKQEGIDGLKNNYIMNSFAGTIFKSTVGTYILYFAAALWAVNDSEATISSSLISRTLNLTFDELKVPYTQEQVNRASKVIGKLAYGFYNKEQDIAKFCFFHALTMYKAGNSIAQSHWPEQSLAWFSQCKPSSSEKKPKNEMKTQALATAENSSGLAAQGLSAQAEVTEHVIWAYYEEDPDMLYQLDTRENGEIVGVADLPDELDEEGVYIESWDLYSLEGFFNSESALKTIEHDYELQASDPQDIVLVPNVQSLDKKRVNLWLNKSMTGFDKDELIGSFEVYDGGYYYIAYSALPEGISDEGFDVLYYGGDERLIDREGVSLNGWINAADNEDDLIGFLPDDFLDYEELPAGDTVDLYAVWLDPVVYGMTYHANRSASDDYQAETAQYSYDSNTLTVTGFEEGDEGLENPGKTFKGWNTAADGSGTWFNTGDVASLSELGLGTRSQYVQDLEKLEALDDYDDVPNHYGEEVSEQSTADDEFEAELEAKYTTHLYAQWEDNSSDDSKSSSASSTSSSTNSSASSSASSSTSSTKTATKTSSATQAKTPSTGDAMMLVVIALAAVAVAAAVILLAARTKRRQ